MERRGHEPEDGERRVATTDVGRGRDDRAELLGACELGERRVGIGDRDEVECRRDLAHRGLEGVRLGGGARLGADQKSVRCSDAQERNPRTASGCVESRTRSSRAPAAAAPLPASPPAQPKTRLNSSGARLEPPIPSTAARRYPSSRTSRARCSSSATRSRIASGRSSQPSQAEISSGALPEAAHSEPSFAQRRSATRSAVHAPSREWIAASRSLMPGRAPRAWTRSSRSARRSSSRSSPRPHR